MLRGGGKAQLRTLKRLLASAAFVAADLRAELCCLTDFGATMPAQRSHRPREKGGAAEAAAPATLALKEGITSGRGGAGAARGVEGARGAEAVADLEGVQAAPNQAATAPRRSVRRGSPLALMGELATAAAQARHLVITPRSSPRRPHRLGLGLGLGLGSGSRPVVSRHDQGQDQG